MRLFDFSDISCTLKGCRLYTIESIKMSKECPITGKGPMVGNNVSHANNKTKRRWFPNLQHKRFWVESQKRFIRLRVSTRAIRYIDKHGIEAVLHDMKLLDQIQ